MATKQQFKDAIKFYNKGYNEKTFKVLTEGVTATYGYNDNGNVGQKGTKIILVDSVTTGKSTTYTVDTIDLSFKGHTVKTVREQTEPLSITVRKSNHQVVLNIKTLELHVLHVDVIYYLNLLASLDKTSKDSRLVNNLEDIESFDGPTESDGNIPTSFFLQV